MFSHTFNVKRINEKHSKKRAYQAPQGINGKVRNIDGLVQIRSNRNPFKIESKHLNLGNIR
jgi:hypothetical protein